jgi:DNA-binding transcriptional LysR family regulator
MCGRIRFRHLHCFLVIARHQNVGAAAKELAITQPALSKTLQGIEDEFPCAAVSRCGRHPAPGGSRAARHIDPFCRRVMMH